MGGRGSWSNAMDPGPTPFVINCCNVEDIGMVLHQLNQRLPSTSHVLPVGPLPTLLQGADVSTREKWTSNYPNKTN